MSPKKHERRLGAATLAAIAGTVAVIGGGVYGYGQVTGGGGGGNPDLWISPTGSDATLCTEAQPCQTFQRAFDVASPGDLVRVGGGTYTRGWGNVAGSKAITFQAVAANEIYGICSCADNVTFDGLNVTSNDGPAQMAFYSTGDNVTFKNGSIGDVIDERGVLTDADNLTFHNVNFHDVTLETEGVHNECIQTFDAQGFTVTNSTFTNCSVMDISLGIRAFNCPCPDPFDHVTLENNTFNAPVPSNGYSVAFWSTQVPVQQPPPTPPDPDYGEMRYWSIKNNYFGSDPIVRPVHSDPETSVFCGNTGGAPTGWDVPC